VEDGEQRNLGLHRVERGECGLIKQIAPEPPRLNGRLLLAASCLQFRQRMPRLHYPLFCRGDLLHTAQ